MADEDDHSVSAALRHVVTRITRLFSCSVTCTVTCLSCLFTGKSSRCSWWCSSRFQYFAKECRRRVGFLSEDVKRTRESPPQLVLQQQENVDATTGTIVDGADRTVEGDTDGALQPQVQQDGNPNTAAKWESLVSIGDDSKSTFEQPRAANSGATTSTGGIMMRMATTTTTALLCLAMLFQ